MEDQDSRVKAEKKLDGRSRVKAEGETEVTNREDEGL